MSRKPKLMDRLDQAAFRLLDRSFPLDRPPVEGVQTTLAEPEIGDQVRTFEAVVKYYGPRTKLGGDEDKKESEFGNLRDRLHGRKTPRSRDQTEAPPGTANGAGDND